MYKHSLSQSLYTDLSHFISQPPVPFISPPVTFLKGREHSRIGKIIPKSLQPMIWLIDWLRCSSRKSTPVLQKFFSCLFSPIGFTLNHTFVIWPPVCFDGEVKWTSHLHCLKRATGHLSLPTSPTFKCTFHPSTLGKFQFTIILSFKNFAFWDPPSPSEFLITLHREGMNMLWNQKYPFIKNSLHWKLLWKSLCLLLNYQ